MEKCQSPRKKPLTLAPEEEAVPLIRPGMMQPSAMIQAIHLSLRGQYQAESVEVLGGTWGSLPCGAESPVKACFLNGSTVVSVQSETVSGPNSIKWHSCIVLIPAIVIGESPDTHLSPFHFLTVLLTVFEPAVLLGSTLTSTTICPTCPNQPRTASMLLLAYPWRCSELLTQYPRFHIAFSDLSLIHI